MSTLREAAQQALEALESWSGMRSLWCAEDQKALDTLRAALEQPEQEPVACARGSDHSEEPLEMVSLAATVKESLPVDCPACGGGGLIPDPTWDWVRCELCNPRLARAVIAKAEEK
jgi:hypothetical protein